MEYRTLAIRTTLKMTVAIPATSMMEARLWLNAMRHRWRQSSGSFDLRQAGGGLGCRVLDRHLGGAAFDDRHGAMKPEGRRRWTMGKKREQQPGGSTATVPTS